MITRKLMHIWVAMGVVKGTVMSWIPILMLPAQDRSMVGPCNSWPVENSAVVGTSLRGRMLGSWRRRMKGPQRRLRQRSRQSERARCRAARQVPRVQCAGPL